MSTTSPESAPSRRVCFTMHLKPDRVDDYLAAHETVWPEMLDALRETGWSNYSLFVDKADALVIGYVETDDFERSLAGMALRPVNDRWQAAMAEYFAADVQPDRTMVQLTEYFHLD
ncbi:L-rhamnose mutarotase [Diaminobutyricibacter sp. McL0618]|uniref:L-rhamnose mutarotase n=1 Tax=Leifsonia sp. McL0618 TaxID=3415677 RepID=UPI003CF19F6A